VRRTVPYRDLAKHNDVTGFVLAIVGIIYAVLLAFVVVITWEEFTRAIRTVDTEVAALADLYQVVQPYKDPGRARVRDEIVQYAHLMKTDEWPAMQQGRYSPDAMLLAVRIQESAIEMIEADTAHQSAVDDAVMSDVRAFLDSRRERLLQNGSGIPEALWMALIIGGILTMGFVYLFGVENFGLQLFMTGILSSLIALMFAITIAIDFPFRGDTSVSSDVFAGMVDRLEEEHKAMLTR
jgi:hypothetical protein